MKIYSIPQFAFNTQQNRVSNTKSNSTASHKNDTFESMSFCKNPLKNAQNMIKEIEREQRLKQKAAKQTEKIRRKAEAKLRKALEKLQKSQRKN